MFLLDPFYGYVQGDFSDEEKTSPAKVLLDMINVFNQIRQDCVQKLEVSRSHETFFCSPFTRVCVCGLSFQSQLVLSSFSCWLRKKEKKKNIHPTSLMMVCMSVCVCGCAHAHPGTIACWSVRVKREKEKRVTSLELPTVHIFHNALSSSIACWMPFYNLTIQIVYRVIRRCLRKFPKRNGS